MWGEQTAIFRFKFSSFQHGVFLTVCVGGGGGVEGGKKREGKRGEKKPGIPQRRSHIFQR